MSEPFNGQKLTFENIADAGQLTIEGEAVIEKLNLIIVTNTKTYDTSIYNVYRYNTLQIANITSASPKALVLAKKNKPNTTALEDGDDVVIIYKESVKDIKIKSKRDFLKNQMTMIKKS